MHPGTPYIPSSAKYWVNCAGYPDLVHRHKPQLDPKSGSLHPNVFRGRAFHAVLEVALKARRRPPAELVNYRWKDPRSGYLHRLEESDVYQLRELYDYVIQRLTPNSCLLLEHPVDVRHAFPDAPWQEPQINTSLDIGILTPVSAEILDAKLGHTAVPIEHKPPRFPVDEQVFLYAAGLLEHPMRQILGFGDVENLRLSIYQPNALEVPAFQHKDLHIREYRALKLEMADRLAATTDSARKKLTPGSWCGYCPAQGVCKAHVRQIHGALNPHGKNLSTILTQDPNFYTPEELAQLFPLIPVIRAHLNKVEGTMLQLAQQGHRGPWKIIRRRRHKAWTDPEKVWEWVKQTGFPVSVASRHELRTPSQLENLAKTLGLSEHELQQLRQLYEQPLGDLGLVPETSPVPPASATSPSGLTVEQMFQPLNQPEVTQA